MPLSTQQLADVETLLLIWYQTIRELGGRVAHQPSGKQLLYWVETYGYAATEQGLRRGIRGFLRKKDGIVQSEHDAVYMVNYLNATIRGLREGFEDARRYA